MFCWIGVYIQTKSLKHANYVLQCIFKEAKLSLLWVISREKNVSPLIAAHDRDAWLLSASWHHCATQHWQEHPTTEKN
jgi:hypothetical protein